MLSTLHKGALWPGSLWCVFQECFYSAALQTSHGCWRLPQVTGWGCWSCKKWQGLGKSGCKTTLRGISAQKGSRLEACHLLGGCSKRQERGGDGAEAREEFSFTLTLSLWERKRKKTREQTSDSDMKIQCFSKRYCWEQIMQEEAMGT